VATTSSPERLDFAAADRRLDGALSRDLMGVALGVHCYRSVLLFPGDVTLDGDLLDALRPLGLDGADLIVVVGDLTVNGRIALYAGTPALHVSGLTRAETLEAGDAEVQIGDGVFTHLVCGWGSNGILGAATVDTPWLINFYHEMWIADVPRGYHLSTTDKDGADFTAANIADRFVPDVVTADGTWVVVEEFLDRLRAGLPVLHDA
jgi:hypothetical protein